MAESFINLFELFENVPGRVPGGSFRMESNGAIYVHAYPANRFEIASDRRMRARRNPGATEPLGAQTIRPSCAWMHFVELFEFVNSGMC